MSKDKYFSIINCFLAIVVYFAWDYFVGYLISFFDVASNVGTFIGFGSKFILLLIILMFYEEDLIKSFIDFCKNFKKYSLKALKIFLVGFLGFAVINSVLYSVFPDFSNTISTFGNYDVIFSETPILFILCTLFYYPIIEEIVFKRNFKKVLNNRWSFVIITGLLNAFFQIAFSLVTPLGLLNIIPCSILYMSFSYMYYETDNVVTSMFFRMAYNLIPVIANLVAVAIIL